MKTKYKIIIGIIIAAAIYLPIHYYIPFLGIGSTTETFIFCEEGYAEFRGECTPIIESTESELEPQSAIQTKAKQLVIDNIMEAIDSEELSYDEKKEYIKFRYEQDPYIIPSLALRIKDFPRELEEGERPTFTLIEAGYANPCTAPQLEVYLIKGERGLDSFSEDEPIFEGRIVYSCPEFEKFYPILNYWDEQDFPLFPACRYEGIHVIVGDSGMERGALEEYYCNSSKQFEPPKTFEIIIPKGASDPELEKNFIPNEIQANWGDILRFVNQDDVRHRIIGDSDRHPDPTTVEFVFYLKPGELEEIKITYDGIHWLRSEYPTDETLPWMNATIYVESMTANISENDRLCQTQWIVGHDGDLVHGEVETTIEDTIRGFGPQYNIPSREITTEVSGNVAIISVMGNWDQKTSEYEEITSAIFNIDEIIEDRARAIVCE